MGTDSENTLEINDFRGISRFYASPNNPPNNFQTLQNLYSPNRGELKPLGGTVLSQAASTTFSANGFGDLFSVYSLNGELIILSGYPTAPTLPTPVVGNFTFTTVGGAGSAHNYKISYVGVGGESALSSASAAVNFGASGVDVTIPAGISKAVSAINFYVFNTNTDYTWVATCCRQQTGSGETSFPTTLRIRNEVVTEQNGSAAPANAPVDDPTTITFTPTTGGSLVGGTTYFFGFAPWVRAYTGGSYWYFPKVCQTVNTGAYIAYTLPQGFTAVTITANLSGKYDGVNTYTASCVFMGTSYEDMLIAPADTLSADYQPFTASSVSGAGVTIYSLPKNNNLGFVTHSGSNTTTNVEFRRAYYILSHQLVTGGLAAVATATTVDFITGTGVRQILPIRGDTVYNVAGTSTVGFIQSHGQDTSSKVQGAVLAGRLFLVNGFQSPTYTNGYLLKPIYPDYQTANPPITTSLIAFKNRLIMSGGITNIENTDGLVYYTALDAGGSPNPFRFTETPVATPARNSASIRSDTGGSFRGFGVYSINELTIGPKTQLVAGQENAVWMTNDITSGLQEVKRGAGFASLNCFVNTNIGAFFVGRDNLYLLTPEGGVVPKGNDVASILKTLDLSANSVTAALFSEGHIKILYNSSGSNTGALNRELWCDCQVDKESDRPRMVWTGPHTKDTTVGQIVARTFSTFTDQRMAISTTSLLRLDDSSTTGNQGSNVARQLLTNDLTLSQDHFMKLLTRIYVAARVNLTHTLTLTITMTDDDGAGLGTGTGAITTTSDTFALTVGSIGSYYKLFQKIFSSRIRGRVARIQVDFSSGAAGETISIYDMSLLFKTQRRRLL